MKFKLITVAAFLGALSTGSGQTIPNTVTLRDFFPGLTFTRPVHMVPYPGKDSAYIVVEQLGTAQLVQRAGGVWVKSIFVSVPVSGGSGEDGLLGFAFHPNFLQNRKYYTYFLRNSAGLGDYVAERLTKSNLSSDSAGTERVLLRVSDPASNHNGGTIAFGQDGFLYIGIGDGGPQNDPDNRAQNTDSLLGKILRIDVNSQSGGLQYAIPSTNPFVGQSGFRGEIWAYGFRNPYRWSFHPTRGEMWVGDVGQNAYEEVSLVPKSGNMGWKIREGMHCRPGGPTTCSTAGLIDPVVERPHAGTSDNAIIGGVFFRGDPLSAFHDVYFFGDNGSGSIWAMQVQNGVRVADLKVATLAGLSSFANDSKGRVFAMSVQSSTIRILESPDMRPGSTSVRLSQGQKPISKRELDRGAFNFKTVDGRQFELGKASGLMVVEDKNGKVPPRIVPALW